VSSVIFDMNMSLDGYVRAANPRPDEPLGEGGEALHAWAMDDDAAGRDVLERGVAGTGAVICGRATCAHRARSHRPRVNVERGAPSLPHQARVFQRDASDVSDHASPPYASW
jgi:hypothetical protein